MINNVINIPIFNSRETTIKTKYKNPVYLNKEKMRKILTITSGSGQCVVLKPERPHGHVVLDCDDVNMS